MRDKRNYLIVDASDMIETIYEACNNQIIDYNYSLGKYKLYNFSAVERHNVKYVVAKDIFQEYSIPEEYQKIVIRMCIFENPFIKNEAEEFFTKYPFDITGHKLIIEEKKKYLVGSAALNNPTSKIISFKTPLQYVGYNEIMNFYRKLKDNNYLVLYLRVLSKIFGLGYNLDTNLESQISKERRLKNK